MPIFRSWYVRALAFLVRAPLVLTRCPPLRAQVTQVPGFAGLATLAALFEASTQRHGARRMLGERRLLSVDTEERGGRKTERRSQGDYTWMTYAEARAARARAMRTRRV
jgi:hypothetical protein